MNRYFLVSENQSRRGVPADVKQRLNAYREAKEETRNLPPHIRPQPLAKYESSKWSRVENADDDKPSNAAPEHAHLPAVKLPAYAKSKASKVAPFFSQLTSIPQNVDSNQLFLDLVLRRKKKKTPMPIVKQIASKLVRQPNFDPKWLDPGVISSVKKTPLKKKKLNESDAGFTTASEDDGQSNAANRSGRASDVATADPNHNAWARHTDILPKPAWISN